MNCKSLISLSIIVLAGMALLGSCQSNSKSMYKADNDIYFDTLHLEKEYVLEGKQGNPSCNLNVTFIYPQRSARFDTEKLKAMFLQSFVGPDYAGMNIDEAMDKYVRNYIENYKRDAETYRTNKPGVEYNDPLEDIWHEDNEQANLPEIFYSYYETLSNAVLYNKYGVISFQVRQTNSKGGSVTHENVRNFSYHLPKNEMLTEGDLFVGGYEAAMRTLIQNTLMEQNNVKSLDELEDLGFFGVDEIVPNKNFYVTEKGIHYTFNKGEYSAYQLPVNEICIPYAQLRPFMREKSLIEKIID